MPWLYALEFAVGRPNQSVEGSRAKCKGHAHLVVLHTVVLLVQAVRSPSPRRVVTCTTVSPITTSWQNLACIPADNLHCTVSVAAAAAVGHNHHSLVVVKVLLEEVDSLNNLAACLEISKSSCRAK